MLPALVEALGLEGEITRKPHPTRKGVHVYCLNDIELGTSSEKAAFRLKQIYKTKKRA